jgi:glycosyltransferase involved in cell wall biosynthesis
VSGRELGNGKANSNGDGPRRGKNEGLLTSDLRPLTSDLRPLTSDLRPLTSILFNADRVLNRFWDYPRLARRIRNDFDLFHLVDHSYGQLLHQLPPERTVVTCHDLDTFQCLLNPEKEPRSVLFRAMMKRTLKGLSKAAFVTCDSVATRDELLAHKLISPDRLLVVPNGVHPSCAPEANPAADAEAELLIRGQKSEVRSQRSLAKERESLSDSPFALFPSSSSPGPELLHVGSTIPRKRIDLLLRVFAAVRKQFPDARLIRVGGAFTADQAALADELHLLNSIVVLPHIDRDVLAAVYRRSALVLLPSEREGFGLPVVEAMACGTPVVASDLPVLREVGGDAASYCAVGEVNSWSRTIGELLLERNEQSAKWAARRQRSLVQASRFSWFEYAHAMTGIYEEVLRAAKSKVYLGTYHRGHREVQRKLREF